MKMIAMAVPKRAASLKESNVMSLHLAQANYSFGFTLAAFVIAMRSSSRAIGLACNIHVCPATKSSA